MNLPSITECRECGSTSLTWDTHNKNISQAQHGRLTTQDIRCQFVLGCDHCSETLAVVSADQVAAWLTETRETSAEPSAPVNQDIPVIDFGHSITIDCADAFRGTVIGGIGQPPYGNPEQWTRVFSINPGGSATFKTTAGSELRVECYLAERDERAEFEAWTVSKGRVVGYSGWREDFVIWQARAALERKS